MHAMIVAGEASGDLHGSGVAAALKRQDPACAMFGIGGDHMRDVGMELLYHIDQFAFMGLVEVVKHLPFIRRALKHLAAVIEERHPDVLVLVDYPDFNLRLARIAKRLGIPVLFYISPQIWAWRPGRIHRIVKLVDQMAVVFPFEVELYKRAGGNVEFVGHPMLEELSHRFNREEFCQTAGLDAARPILGLLPGSRSQEVSRLLPPMAGTVRAVQSKMPEVQGVIGLAPTVSRSSARSILEGSIEIPMVEGLTYDVMHHADLLIVTSGTATLESACFSTPLMVVYKMSPLSYWIGRHVVRIPDIGLVNVVAGKRVVPEFIQGQVRPEILASEALSLLRDPQRLADTGKQLSGVRSKLGTPGASDRVAAMAIELALESGETGK